MKRNGFILIETITMFLVLVSALILFYVLFNNIFIKEKEYAYYDDISSIYSTYYLKEALSDYSTINSSLNNNIFANNYGLVVGLETDFLNWSDSNYFYNVADKLYVYQMFITNDIYNLKACARLINDDPKCLNTFMTDEFRSYVKTINVKDVKSDYYLLVEFRKDKNGQKCLLDECYSYYSWVAL